MLTPANNRIIVEEIKSEKKILQQSNIVKGKIVSSFKEGETVVYDKNDIETIILDGKTYEFLDEKNIIAYETNNIE